jgi:hypothetical protein
MPQRSNKTKTLAVSKQQGSVILINEKKTGRIISRENVRYRANTLFVCTFTKTPAGLSIGLSAQYRGEVRGGVFRIQERIF